MKYTNISEKNLTRYLSDIDNAKVLFKLVQDMTTKEFEFFMKSQGVINDVKAFLSTNSVESESLIEKIKNLDNRLLDVEEQSEVTENFMKHFSNANDIKIGKKKDITKVVHDFEEQNKTLACDMSVEMIHDMMRCFNSKTSDLSVKLLAVADYVDALIHCGYSVSCVNRVRTIDVCDIDITDIMKRTCVGNKDELMGIIRACFPAIEDNIATNRLVLILLLAYDGVEPADALTLRDSDVVDGVLHYKDMEIKLDDTELKIIEQWKSGYCFAKENSRMQSKMMDSDLLIKTIQPFNIRTMSVLMNGAIQKKSGIKQLSIRDTYLSGVYSRYNKSNNYTKSYSYGKKWENDFQNWQKAFSCV